MIRQEGIPFLDLVVPHLELQEELTSVFQTTLRTAGFVGGPMVEDFEREYAQFCGIQDCIGVGSGTDALRFALIASGVRSGMPLLQSQTHLLPLLRPYPRLALSLNSSTSMNEPTQWILPNFRTSWKGIAMSIPTAAGFLAEEHNDT